MLPQFDNGRIVVVRIRHSDSYQVLAYGEQVGRFATLNGATCRAEDLWAKKQEKRRADLIDRLGWAPERAGDRYAASTGELRCYVSEKENTEVDNGD